MLTRLALAAEQLAHELHARALAAEQPDTCNAYVLSFQRTVRAVRQTLALKARLERDGARKRGKPPSSRLR
jgi:hypothetical protein